MDEFFPLKTNMEKILDGQNNLGTIFRLTFIFKQRYKKKWIK